VKWVVADGLRRESARQVQALAAGERIELALALGDAGIEAFCSAQGVSHDEGAASLRRQRQQGRRPSACLRRPPA
jgi:hypothetical protein